MQNTRIYPLNLCVPTHERPQKQSPVNTFYILRQEKFLHF